MTKEPKSFEKENWRKAKGIPFDKRETNSGLAVRDYSVNCIAPSPTLITICNGYHIWWCSAHHQPLALCDKERVELKVRKQTLEDVLKEVKKRYKTAECVVDGIDYEERIAFKYIKEWLEQKLKRLSE